MVCPFTFEYDVFIVRCTPVDGMIYDQYVDVIGADDQGVGAYFGGEYVHEARDKIGYVPATYMNAQAVQGYSASYSTLPVAIMLLCPLVVCACFVIGGFHFGRFLKVQHKRVRDRSG